jgi:hypothetical protein
MFEICAFLGTKKTPKPRKPAGFRVIPGALCSVWGHSGTVVGKHPTLKNWWNVKVGNSITGFHRSQIDFAS